MDSFFKRTISSVKFYVACLIPVSYSSLNVNYLFLLIHGQGRHRMVHDIVLKSFIFYLPVCYLLGLFITMPMGMNALFRQLLSLGAFFVAWMTVFITFDRDNIANILRAVVYVAVLYSLWVIVICITIFREDIFLNTFGLKILLRPYVWGWPQYYAPILIFAFMLVFSKSRKKFVHYVILLILLSCIYLTSIRSVYLALFPAMVAYSAIKLKDRIKQGNIRVIVRSAIYASILIIIVVVFFRNNPLYLNFIEQVDRIITSATNFIQNNSHEVGSDSNRVSQWKVALEILNDTNPITGTGFAGIHLFPQATAKLGFFMGSLDSQIFDTLFKMGVVGLLFILYCFMKLIKYFYTFDVGVCCAIFSIFVYSFFHTTYQSPYVAFLLFSLLSFVDLQTMGNRTLLHRKRK